MNAVQIADYNRKRIIFLAKKYYESKICPKCKIKNKWKIVPLFEYGDMFLPSQIVAVCDSCKQYNNTFAKTSEDEAKKYANKILEQEYKGFKVAPEGTADKLIGNPKKGRKK